MLLQVSCLILRRDHILDVIAHIIGELYDGAGKRTDLVVRPDDRRREDKFSRVALAGSGFGKRNNAVLQVMERLGNVQTQPNQKKGNKEDAQPDDQGDIDHHRF